MEMARRMFVMEIVLTAIKTDMVVVDGKLEMKNKNDDLVSIALQYGVCRNITKEEIEEVIETIKFYFGLENHESTTH